ncbi:MAG: hypothetical protein U1E34_06805 [Amaricoccus sp.]
MAIYTGDDAGNNLSGVDNDTNLFDAKGGNDTVRGGYLYDGISLGDGDDVAMSGDGSDFVNTGSGNDNVSAGAGDDIIISDDGLATDSKLLDGESGDDIFVLGASKEFVIGGFGEDLISYNSSSVGVRVDLVAGKGSGGSAAGDTYSSVEAVYGSSKGDVLIGNGAFNVLSGYSGDDTIRGGAGGDSLHGGADFDTLDYRTSDAGVRIDLAKLTAYGGDAQGDSFADFENVDGTDFGDRLTGDAGANRLRGFDGKDRLAGGDGADILSGGGGADRLTGGKGADVLRGGSGADSFVFRSAKESGLTGAARDEILDFRHGQHDRIDLSAIDANSDASGNQHFDFIGSARFQGVSGEVRVVKDGGDLLVLGDVNGDRHSDFSILVADLGSLRADDFIL